MPSTTILFSDIVGFSTLTVDRQVEVVNRSTQQTTQHTRRWLNPPIGQPEVIGLPTDASVSRIRASNLVVSRCVGGCDWFEAIQQQRKSAIAHRYSYRTHRNHHGYQQPQKHL